ncbi:MAG: magnesium transporter [Planctomycetota bacterium]|jgi:magnesium transporter
MAPQDSKSGHEELQRVPEAAPETLSDAPEETQIDDPTATSPEDERVARLLAHTIDVPVLAEAVEQQEAPDAADTLEDLEEEEAADVLVEMDDRSAAEALAEMEDPLAAGVLDELLEEGNAAYAARLIQLMASDDAADVLQTIDDSQRDVVYRAMPHGEAAKLRRLVGYDEESAAGLMTIDYIAMRDDMTVAEAIEAIRASELPQALSYLPVIEANGTLAGVIGLRALLLHNNEDQISDIMSRSVRAIRADLDQEEVAREFDRYDYFMRPVLDQNDRLLGIVTVDDVIDLIREEQTEDVQKTVGAGAGEAVYSRIGEKFRGRFPWLAASLMLTCFAAIVVLFFEDLIREVPVLAFLMPVIAALVGNAGHQALAVTLRGLVLDEVRPERVLPLVWREAQVGLINGTALGLLVVLVMGLLSGVVASASWRIGLVAGVALAVSMCAGTLAGSSIPLVMRRLGFDPAQSSTIFLIMITDAVAFATFLGLAHLTRGWLGITGSAV